MGAEVFRYGEYTPGMLEAVRATCLFLATKLRDVLDDVVIVGGLVPQLLVDPASLGPGEEAHVGTQVLDLGLRVQVLDDLRYEAVAARFREAGFRPDTNAEGNPVFQRWVLVEAGTQVTVDFLIPRTGSMEAAVVQKFGGDFGAIRVRGLALAFEDRKLALLSGRTILGELVEEPVLVPVCGIASFLVLKAFAFRGRGKNKDVYDLYWILRHYPGGPRACADEVRPFLGVPEVTEALGSLRGSFASADHLGPMRVARFRYDARDDDLQAAAFSTLQDFFDAL